MSRITRRKQEAPKRMKYGENGTKLEPLATPSSEESQNQEEENESEDDGESGKENESSRVGSPLGDINVVDDCPTDEPVQETTPLPEPRDMPTKTEPPLVSSPAPPIERQVNDESKWRREPLNGVVKMETEIMDLSSKRRRSSSDDSEPEVKVPRKAPEVKRDESQPLDLSQKSSRSFDEPQVIRHRRPVTPPSTSQPLPISPSLASLQKKFGGQVNSPKAPIEVARSNKSPPVTSQARMWYSNVYRQSMAPYAMYQTKMPYYPLDVPLHASYPALAGNLAVGLMPDLSLGNVKPPKAAPTVSMTTKSQTSITQSPNKHKSLLPKLATPNGNPQISPMTSPRGPLTSMSGPTLNFDLKEAKTNCIDFKCDCGKSYNTLYELSVHMQDTGHMPRNTKAGPSGDYPKLVRGQDMWLNNGLEQTKQILRCMHCGESFKTLPELTVHMMKTQHYADIFSSAHRKMHKCTTFFEKENDTKSVFKCRVCETEYESLDSLANHMVESRHHKRSSSRAVDDPIKVGQGLLATITNDDCDSTSDRTSPLVSPNVKPETVTYPNVKPETVTYPNVKPETVMYPNVKPETVTWPNVKPETVVTYPKLEPHDGPRDHHTTTSDDVIMKMSRKDDDVTMRDDVKHAELKKPSVPTHHNGDVNHNTTDKDSRSSMTSPVTSEHDVRAAMLNGRDSPISDNEEGEHNIKCENCFERIKTDLFVEHVRHCISKERKMTSKPPIVTSLPSPPPLERAESRPKNGSALKAMEQFIENFNDRKPHKSQAPMSSLLYDYVGPLGGQKPPVNGERPPVDKLRPYYDRGGDHSALHNLYRFTSYGPQRLPPPRVQESPSRINPVSRSPLPSPKSITTSPRTSPVRDVTMNSDDVIVRTDDVVTTSSSTETARKEEPSRTPVSPAVDTSDSPPTPTVKERCERGSCSSPGDGGYHSNDMDSATDDQKRTMTSKNLVQNGSCMSPHTSSPKSTDSEAPPNGKTSALASLRGLVDKHMDKSEHPLNSLQKLINQTDGNHSSNVTSLQTRLINVTSSPYWFSFSHLTRGWQGAGAGACKSDSPGSDRGADENRSVVDSDGVEVKVSDLKCDNCGKLFSSRGGCRYHRSKCVLSTQTKISGSKEAQIVQTPYTYMPLEHTNKFSKYYEMARELANKSN